MEPPQQNNRKHILRGNDIWKRFCNLEPFHIRDFQRFFAESVSSTVSYCRVFPGKVDICGGFPVIHLTPSNIFCEPNFARSGANGDELVLISDIFFVQRFSMARL